MRHFSKTPFIMILIYLVPSIYLSTVPLFNILGYEFSLSMSFISYLVCGFYLMLSFDSFKESSNPAKGLRLSLDCVLFSLIPLVFMTIKGFFITNCNYWSGAGFYILLPVVSAFFGSSMGFVSSAFLKTPPKRTILFMLISLLVFLKTPYQLIYGPNVDAFNHIFGYFAGPIYDETVRIGAPLIAFRIYSLAISFALFFASAFILEFKKKAINQRAILAISIFLIALSIFSNLFSSSLGFSRRANTIKKELNQKHDSKHFSFHYSKPDNLIRPLTEEFEFRHFQIGTELDLRDDRKVSVFIYPDPKTQKRLMGSGGIFIAKPSNMQIHMTINSPITMPVKHELTHVLAGSFGMAVIKISPRVALLEGLAVALEKYERDMTLSELAKASIQLELAPNIEDIMSPWGFWSKPYARTYYVAGSFSRHIIDAYGIKKFKEAYKGGSFQKIYGKPLKALSKEWKAMLETVKLSDEKLKRAEAMFKPRGIFERKCAHEVASLIQRSKACAAKKGCRPAGLIEKALNLSDNDPSISLKLAKAHFDSGDFKKAYRSALDIFKDTRDRKEADIPSQVLEAGLRTIADYHAANGDGKKALSIYEKIKDHAGSPVMELENKTRIALVKTADPETFADYLTEKDDLKKVSILKQILLMRPKDPILNFTAGYLYFQKSDFKNSSYFLSKIVSLTEPLRMYRLKLLGISHFYLKNYREAAGIFLNIKRDYKDEAIKLFADDWLEKIDFYSNNIYLPLEGGG